MRENEGFEGRLDMIALLIIAVVVIVIVVYNVNKAKKREAELAAEREAEKRKIQKRNEEKKLREEGRPLQKADGLTRKYMEKPIIIEASQRVKQKFVACKEDAIRRAEHFNMEHSNGVMCVKAGCSKDGRCSKIGWGDERELDFRKENLQCLHTREDMEACVRAIAILAYQQISRECSEDKNADVCVREYLSSEISGECKFYITLQYLFANPNYAPPAEW